MMKRTFLVTFVLLFVAAFLWAQLPSLEPDPDAYEYAARIQQNGTYRDYLETALWASGVPHERMQEYIVKVDKLIDDLRASDIPDDVNGRGEYLLQYLHQKVFRSYSEHATKIDDIFLNGRFNCVSSAVIYLICWIGIDGADVEGVKTPDHAYLTIINGDERIDVQTTNRNGFAYITDEENKEVISKIELVSLILYNRVAQLEKRNQFAQVIPLVLNRLALLNENSRYDDSIQKLLNLGIHYINIGQYDNAIAWIMAAESVFPDEAWNELLFTAAQHKLANIIRTNKPLTEARSLLAAVESKIDIEKYAELQSMLYDAQAVELVNKIKMANNAEEVLVFLDQIRGNIPEQRWNEMVTAAILNGADNFGKLRDIDGAVLWITGAIEKYGNNRRFEAALRMYQRALQ